MNKFKLVLCLCLIFLFAFSGCGGASNKPVSYISSKQYNIGQKAESKSVFVQNEKLSALEKIAGSDNTGLYYDKKKNSFALYDFAGKAIWRSLPESYAGDTAAAVLVNVIVDGREYTLNSQTASVQKGLCSCEIKDGSISLTYAFKEKYENGVIDFSVPMVLEVVDGVLTVSVDCSKITTEKCSRGVIIQSISLLPYFGSGTKGEKGDFIFIPDGCGAVIDLGTQAKKGEEYEIPVYGDDVSAPKNLEGFACVPAFGMKRGSSAFVALIENADAISSIVASRSGSEGGYNSVGARFDLVSVLHENGGIYTSPKSYDEEIRITYKLLSGDSASYAGMASALREELIKNGALSMKEQEGNSSTLPCILTLYGEAESEKQKKQTVLTSFVQGEEILTFFRSKGLTNIVLRYRGLLGSGVCADAASLKFNSALGSKKDRQAFLDFSKKLNIEVYGDADFTFAKRAKSKNEANKIDGEKAEKKFTALSASSAKSAQTKVALSQSTFMESVNDMLVFQKKQADIFFCLPYAGSSLSSDFSWKKPTLRQRVKASAFNALNALSSGGSLMVERGNIYAVKDAKYIVALPMSAKTAKNEGVSAVPFLQILLHGYTTYCGSSINTSANTETAMLKCAEYGCVPSFEFYYGDNGTKKKPDSYYYLNFGTEAQQSYERLSNTFSSLQNKKITAHYTVSKGVTCTEYGGRINVYVNYNKTDVTVSGVTIEGRSFLAVG